MPTTPVNPPVDPAYAALRRLEAARDALLFDAGRIELDIADLKRREPRLEWDGDHIRDLRESRHLTKRALAAEAGLHPSTIRRIERNGTGGKCAGRTALLVVRALDVTFAEFANAQERGWRAGA